MTQPERIIELSRHVSQVAEGKIALINAITRETRILALNALIESARAGESGRGFGVVANEVKVISERITEISQQLSTELAGAISELVGLGEGLVQQVRGQRLVDLAFNMVEIIDRNLYERSCDVRWWATDAAAVDAVANLGAASAGYASERLGVILNSYTVYLDLWIADATGRVIANGRPQKYSRVIGSDVSATAWFKAAMATASGDDYAAFDVERLALLDNAQVATYTTAIRAGGKANGKPLGALGIFFDWEPQAEAIVRGSQISAAERDFTRCLLLDANHRVIAASDGKGILSETLALPAGRGQTGYHADGNRMVGFALTPGYETYRGLGWYGAIVQELPGDT
jgi:hypothetical protein